MTVAELVKALKFFHPDRQVVFHDDHGNISFVDFVSQGKKEFIGHVEFIVLEGDHLEKRRRLDLERPGSGSKWELVEAGRPE